MKICLVTDAWAPQMNGVVRTLFRPAKNLTALGHDVTVISPDQFFNLACPTYPEIRLALFANEGRGADSLNWRRTPFTSRPRGPLGMAARRYCIAHELPFTTAYHTRFPEYVAARFAVPVELDLCLAATIPCHRLVGHGGDRLDRRGPAEPRFRNIRRWSRGVDTELFQPRDKAFSICRADPSLCRAGGGGEEHRGLPGLDLKGSKVVVGDGPQLAELKRKYP